MDQKRLTAVLSALAQPMRLEAMSLLMKASPDGLPASEVAAAVKSAPSNMSVHFRMLLMAGLVSSERRSRQIIYTANTAVVAEALAELGSQLDGQTKETVSTKARKPALKR